jgi:uncharacterized protein with beta-barrel porin domain
LYAQVRYLVNKHTDARPRLVGVAVGGSEHFSVPDRATSGDLLGGHVGAYGMQAWGAL